MGDKEDVRIRLDIVDYIGQTIQLKRSGRNFKGLCPFHNEKTPSFFVSPDRQMFKCFGCGASGDIFSFYMQHEGVDFSEALKDLAQKAGVELKDFQPTDDFAQKQELIEIHRLTAKLYHFLLTQHQAGKKALQYLSERGVTLSQIRDVNLGYAPESWRTVYEFLVQKKKYKPETVEKSGLTIKSPKGWYDRFRGRIMFPLSDHRGNLVGFSGRVLPWTDDGKSGKYINSPETVIYHKSQMLFPLHYTKESIRKSESVVIVEGEFDALASIRANVSHVVAVKGSALTPEQVKLLKRYADTVILALDADKAGIAAARRAIAVAQAQDVNIKVVELPEGKDPDELVAKEPKKWRDSVKGAVNVYDFFLDVAKRTHDLTTIDGKQAVSAELIPVLGAIENKVVQDHYVKKLSAVLDTQPSVVEAEMERMKRSATVGRPKPEEPKPETNRLQGMLDELLAIVLHYPESQTLKPLDLEDLPESAVKQILSAFLQAKPKDLIAFSKTLPSQLQHQFDDGYLREVGPISEKQLDRKIKDLIMDIANLELRGRLNRLRRGLTDVKPTDASLVKHQINDVLVRLRRYNKQ